MSEPRRALYIGRFQIIHNGHLAVIKGIEAQPDVDEIIIGIGSSQYSRNNPSPEAPLVINPFTYEERASFVRSALEPELRKPFCVHPIPDQHDCGRWAKYVFHAMPKIAMVYTNTRREREQFDLLGKPYRGFTLKDKYHAQIMREMIAHNDPWESMVPVGAVQAIKELHLDDVLRELYASRASELEKVHELQRSMGIMTYNEAILEMRKKNGNEIKG